MVQWKAVDRPELRHMTDVIVCSVKGLRRAADWLSGGSFISFRSSSHVLLTFMVQGIMTEIKDC